MNGIPVTLAVPSHVKVQFVKRYHYTTAGSPLMATAADGKPVPLVTYDFTHEVIQQKKVVLVDFKRPAAGTFEFSGSIDKDTGYFTQIAHKGEDKTIETIGSQVNSLVGTILKGGRSSFGNVPASDGGITTIPTIMATVFIKVTDPDFEQQLRTFVCCSLASAGLPACGCEGGYCPAPGAPVVPGSPGHPLTIPPRRETTVPLPKE
jgi:hypothetical protein